MATLTVVPLSLPKIDLSAEGLSPGAVSWNLVRGEVLRAFQDYGCFEAIYGDDKIDPGLYASAMAQLEELFSLPSEKKRQYAEPGKPYFGYIGDRPMAPLFEAMGISGVLDSLVLQDLAGLLWPAHGNPRFCDTMKAYAKKVSELDLLIKRLVFEGLGVENYFESHVDSTTYAIRFNKYAAPNMEEAQVGVNLHTDKNFMTILQQNHVDGLEIQARDGGWIRVRPSPSSFIVMVGESFLGWCNGRLQCARHRVMVRGHETRYSIALFSGVKGTIHCPRELVDEERPMLFKPFDEIALLNHIHRTEEGDEAESPLTAYFGA